MCLAVWWFVVIASCWLVGFDSVLFGLWFLMWILSISGVSWVSGFGGQCPLLVLWLGGLGSGGFWLVAVVGWWVARAGFVWFCWLIACRMAA